MRSSDSDYIKRFYPPFLTFLYFDSFQWQSLIADIVNVLQIGLQYEHIDRERTSILRVLYL